MVGPNRPVYSSRRCSLSKWCSSAEALGVRGVVTLNEPYETLVPTSLYHAHGIDHLVIPTRDYLFAPSTACIKQAVAFIHRNASCEKTTYVHCKAGRGRSTTIVLCYLVEYKHMTPLAALEYVCSRRPRVMLAHSQWKAVQEYAKRSRDFTVVANLPPGISPCIDEVIITEADLEGCEACKNTKQLSVQAHNYTMMARLSCLFAAWKTSVSASSVANSLPEIRSC